MKVSRFVPERLYEDCTHRSTIYHTLSQNYAANEDYYNAVNAQWYSDTNEILALLWQRVLIASHNPDEKLPQLTKIIYTAYHKNMTQNTAPQTLQELLEAARENSYQAFDNTARRAIKKRYKPTTHLHNIPTTTYQKAAHQYIENANPEETKNDILTLKKKTLETYTTATHTPTTQPETIIALLWESYWTGFEAYLRQTALTVGDTTLTTVTLREACAYHIAEHAGDFPNNPQKAEQQMIQILTETLGITEEQRLLTYLANTQQNHTLQKHLQTNQNHIDYAGINTSINTKTAQKQANK